MMISEDIKSGSVKSDSVGSRGCTTKPYSPIPKVICGYRLTYLLGSGSFGSVFLGRTKEGREAAIKIVNLSVMKDLEKSKAKIKREIEIMKELKHPNVVQLYDTEESGHYIAMVMEYCQGGDLGKVIEHIKTMLCEYEIQSIACQIASGLKLLNEKQILHRDLKLQNVLATSCDFPIKIKLADFGLSKHVADVATTMCGTVPYMAPEQLKGEKYTAKADMWSFGVLLYALVTGSLPFKEKSPKTLLTEIYASAKYVPLTLEKAKVSKICIDFISSLLQINPKDRISDEKLYAHEFISTDPELYKKKHPGLIFTMEKKTKTAGSGSEPSTPTVFCPMSDISSKKSSHHINPLHSKKKKIIEKSSSGSFNIPSNQA